MRILIIHNKYKEAGGEDAVFYAERDLLSKNNHRVEQLVFDNKEINTILDKLRTALKLIYNPAAARMLRERIEEFQPDIIHVHNFVPLASPSVFFVAKEYNIPVILTLHNFRLLCPSVILFHKNRIYEKSVRTLFPIDAILKGVYRGSRFQTAAVVLMTALHAIIGTWRNKIDLYITLTEFARDKFQESALSIAPGKLRLKPNFVVDVGNGDTVRKDFFLFVGRLAEYKGIGTLLKAARLAKFKLVIIGDGPLRNRVMDFVRENPNVSYLGFQDKASVMHHMKTCRGLIFPSVCYESFPVAVLEALSTGTIIIASKLGGIAEIIQHKVNGFHFEGGNEEDLASVIEELNRDPECIRCVSAKARLSYLDHYTPEKNYSLLMEIYKHALALKGKPGTNAMYNPVVRSGNPYAFNDTVTDLNF